MVLAALAVPLGQLLLPGQAAPCGARLVQGLVMGAEHLPSRTCELPCSRQEIGELPSS